SGHPHLGGAAAVELPPLGGGLRRALFHRHAVARLQAHRPHGRDRDLPGTRASLRVDLGPGQAESHRAQVMSNLAARLLTAAALIPLLIVAIRWANPIAVWAIVYAATFVGLREYYNMTLAKEPLIERGFG